MVCKCLVEIRRYFSTVFSLCGSRASKLFNMVVPMLQREVLGPG